MCPNLGIWLWPIDLGLVGRGCALTPVYALVTVGAGHVQRRHTVPSVMVPHGIELVRRQPFGSLGVAPELAGAGRGQEAGGLGVELGVRWCFLFWRNVATISSRRTRAHDARLCADAPN